MHDWTARRGLFARPCVGDVHCFSPAFLGEFRRNGAIAPVMAFDVCTCGAKRWSTVMGWVAQAYGEAATS